MSVRVTIGPRGTVTIPAKLRKAYGLQKDDQMVVEETSDGLLFRPTVNIPIEIYTEERIAEFSSDDAEVGKLLDENSK